MLQVIAQRPGLTVAAVARRLDLPLSLVSTYLRALESRGLLRVRRAGRHVEYRLAARGTGPPAELVATLRRTFRRGGRPADTMFRMATAFTHPRRIVIFRALHAKRLTFQELRAATGIPAPALVRHLRKLMDRRFVSRTGGRYSRVPRRDGLGRLLGRMAVG
jgi:DNA-binding transcriptional ArsR family regulator